MLADAVDVAVRGPVRTPRATDHSAMSWPSSTALLSSAPVMWPLTGRNQRGRSPSRLATASAPLLHRPADLVGRLRRRRRSGRTCGCRPRGRSRSSGSTMSGRRVTSSPIRKNVAVDLVPVEDVEHLRREPLRRPVVERERDLLLVGADAPPHARVAVALAARRRRRPVAGRVDLAEVPSGEVAAGGRADAEQARAAEAETLEKPSPVHPARESRARAVDAPRSAAQRARRAPAGRPRASARRRSAGHPGSASSSSHPASRAAEHDAQRDG